MLLRYFIRRLLWMIPFLFVVSIVVFALIQAPPGDFLTTYVAKMAESNEGIDQATLERMREQYGLDRSLPVQYWKWISGLAVGDFGQSFEWNQSAWSVIKSRLPLTLVLMLSTFIFAWGVALPIGIYSAVRKYTVGDYVVTFFGFLGLATPNFLLALVVLYLGVRFFGVHMGGLFSDEYEGEPWSLAKVIDLYKHLWIGILVLGTAILASLIRIMRANLLDELSKPYVTTARAKGMAEWKLILKYPVRIALNPFISIIGIYFPALISGAVVTAVVLGYPTLGPLMLQSLLAQDMHLAGGILMIMCSLTVVGMLISDILLALLDPRVRYD
ncbi:ABC transporter permease [Oceaniglobus trochenteri]|uniref:ABC transporter permease n=1 Tax=Oceaniglobus trochenteri TaxID=2763260 RepID=UPI001CFF931F|nr:ABC transporter permease [Oceaniglobus trochenteri]